MVGTRNRLSFESITAQSFSILGCGSGKTMEQPDRRLKIGCETNSLNSGFDFTLAKRNIISKIKRKLLDKRTLEIESNVKASGLVISKRLGFFSN